MSEPSGLDKAIELAGGVGELAKRINVSPQTVSNWRRRGTPAVKVPEVVRAVDGKVGGHEIRPDLPSLFPAPEAQAA